MPELDADFEISNNNHLEAEYTINEGQHFDCSFEIFASGTTWGSIVGDIENQTDLIEVLETKADSSTVESLSDDVGTIQDTIDNYGTAVLYNATDFATAEQGAKADTAVQPSALDNYATTSALNTGLASKQNIISDLDTIRGGASDGKTAYNTISNYGDIVTYNASNFATATQGAKADSALQPNDNITKLNNNAGYITSASLPTVNNSSIKFQKNGTDLKTITLNQSSNETINFPIPTQASDINAVPTSRTINSKSLANNVSLNSADVGALSNSTTINDLTTTAQQNALNSNITSALTSQITTNKNNIEDIQDVIPSSASSSNQLADENFVNSSIATNTANFIGTFTSVADLEAYSGILTNNDYAFVETTDTAGNTLYDRYKYTTATTPASWQYEYELNNSSFTSNQWAAINSGANTTNIGQIATNTNDIQSINTTIGGYGNIVTHNTSEFATSIQGGLADTALQPNDNISELNNDSGYITGITSTDVTNALGYTPYDNTNPTGYITGITSNDVTTALGYTPYDSSNPDGYTSNIGTITDVKVDNTSVVTSGVANIDLTGKQDNLTPINNIEMFDIYDYLSNASSTRVNTGITPNVDDIEIELKVRCSTGSWYIFQSRASSSATTYGISGSNSGSSVTFGWCGNILISTIKRSSDRHTLVLKATAKNGASSLYVKDLDTGEENTQTGTYTISSYPTVPIYLWGNYSSQYVSSGNYCYYARIKLGGVLVMDWTPSELNDTIGFYDKVTKTLKTPESGSVTKGTKIGDFISTTGFATVATSGSYNDLINTPTIPAAQVNSDWNAVSGVSEILNKPTIPTVYNSTITITQGGVTKGSFTLNQSSGDTIALDAGGGGTVDQTYDKTSANAQSGVAILGLLETMYPVGSLYISKNSTNPLASLFGTWQLVASNKALWTGDGTNGGTTKAAGLPSITGLITSRDGNNSLYSPFTTYSTISSNSALRLTAETSKIKSTSLASSTYNNMAYISFDASKSSTIYGNASTVQPPAYVVNVWERTA